MFIFLSRNFNNSFRLSIKNDLGLLSVGFTSPCNCWKKFAPPSQPIKCKNKTDPNLFASVFSCVKLVASLFFQFSLVNNDVNPYSEWQLRLIWFWFFDTIKNCSISTIINCREKNTWVTLTS